MIEYANTSSGAEVRRGMSFRVTLRGALDLGHILNPFTLADDWATFVERWRAAVVAGKSLAAATVSVPALTEGNIGITSRAVVDVNIIGAEMGVSVSSLAQSWDALIAGIDVVKVEGIGAPSASGRAGALNDASTQAGDPFGLKRVFSEAKTILVLVVLGIVLITLRRRSRGDF